MAVINKVLSIIKVSVLLLKAKQKWAGQVVFEWCSYLHARALDIACMP